MDKKVGPVYHFLGYLSTACQKSLLVNGLLTLLIISPCQGTHLCRLRYHTEINGRIHRTTTIQGKFSGQQSKSGQEPV